MALGFTIATNATRAGTKADRLEARLLRGVSHLSRSQWNAMFPGDGEDWDYYRAAEATTPDGFSAGALAVTDGSHVLAAAPLFRTHYQLHASLQGKMRERVDRLVRPVPRLVNVPVIGLGSPLLDRCHIGYDPSLSQGERQAALSCLLKGLAHHADRDRIPILSVKDLHDGDVGSSDAIFRAAGFGRITSLPIVQLDLPFSTEEAYLASLPEGTASYLKRKMRALSKMRVEYATSIDGLEDQIHALYEETRLNSASDYGEFEKLHPGYFRAVMEQCGPRAQLMLCWHGDTLVSFQLFMAGEREVIAKFIGMRYPLARELNAYFINWMLMIRFAIERGIPRIRMGNTSYSVKLMFGGRIEHSYIYFRHRRSLINWGFQRAAPFMDYERNDLELKRLREEKRI